MNRKESNILYLPTVGVLLCSLAIFLFLNHFSIIRSLELFINERSFFLIPMLLFLYILLMTAREKQRFKLIFVALAPLTFYLLFMSSYNVAIGFNMVLPQPPVIDSLPADNGRSLLGFIPLFITGLLFSYIFAEEISTTERIFVALGLGFGITSLIMILLGIFCIITLTNVLAFQLAVVSIALILVAWRRINLKASFAKSPKEFISKISFHEMIFVFLLGIFIAIATYQTIAYPPYEWDSLAYGVNYAKKIFDYKGIPVIAGPSIGFEMSAAYPPSLQMLACYFYEIAGSPDDFYYRVLQPIFGIATLMVTYELTSNLVGSRRYALIGVWTLAATFLFWIYFIHSSYEMYLTFMVTLTIYFLYKTHKSTRPNSERYEILASIFAGFSALISYIGLSIIGFLLLYSLRERKISKRKISLVLLIVLIISPWYIRNLLLLKNPIYPFLGFGINLDPLLNKSTALHFQKYKSSGYSLESFSLALHQPAYWICILTPLIFYPVVLMLRPKQKENILWRFFLYSFAVLLGIALLHVLFSRLFSFFLPLYSSLVAFNINLLKKLRMEFAPKRFISTFVFIAWIALLMVSFINAFALMSSINFPRTPASDKWDYFRQVYIVYNDTDTWKWINQNIPTDVRVATYEIREYYIERGIMLLDGYESVPLYGMSDIEDAINYLREHNVGYVLSVPWASPLDSKMPPAYQWNIVMKNLGHSEYLPPVYVSPSGAALYHVGPIDDQESYDNFWSKNFVPPLKSIEFNLTVTNATTPPRAMIHVPVPCDYGKGLMMVSLNTYSQNVSVELFKGLISRKLKTDWWKQYEMIKRGPPLDHLGIKDPGFTWTIDSGGYFTLVIPFFKSFTEPFNVTVNIHFYTELEAKTLFIENENFNTEVTFNNSIEPPAYLIYLELKSPSIVSIRTENVSRNINMEIFKDLVPLNIRTMWQLAETHAFTLHAERNTTNNTLTLRTFLVPGKYTLALTHSDKLQTSISLPLEITIKPLI